MLPLFSSSFFRVLIFIGYGSTSPNRPIRGSEWRTHTTFGAAFDEKRMPTSKYQNTAPTWKNVPSPKRKSVWPLSFTGGHSNVHRTKVSAFGRVFIFLFCRQRALTVLHGFVLFFPKHSTCVWNKGPRDTHFPQKGLSYGMVLQVSLVCCKFFKWRLYTGLRKGKR